MYVMKMFVYFLPLKTRNNKNYIYFNVYAGIHKPQKGAEHEMNKQENCIRRETSLCYLTFFIQSLKIFVFVMLLSNL